MKDYSLTVGLEIHAELKTQTKMFCNSKNSPDEANPNMHVCPVCLGYPGTLPVINKNAVRGVLCLGKAVKGRLANYTEFDRKNYFYPDIPKGYQISQYKYPLVSGGELAGVKLTRIHLEEDTAKSVHDSKGDSLLDFNRAGVPLVELVTEPVIKTAAQAANFARELQLLLRYLGLSEANMEKGQMRVEANISVSRNDELGKKVEVKNLNSFRAVEKAINHEFDRQSEILDKGAEVLQETRGWDEEGECTFSQRVKEDSHDYRYFPDPDLPKLFLDDVEEFKEESLESSLPELPWQKRERYRDSLGLKESDIEIYIKDDEKARLVEEVATILKDKEKVQLASNYITSDIKSRVPAESVAEVALMIVSGEVSSRGAKEILKIIETEGGNAKEIAEENNLIQTSDREELEKIAKKIVDDYSEVVKEYRGGKISALEFLVGQMMKVTKGKANPQLVKEIFSKIL